LENICERIVIFTKGDLIGIDDLPNEIGISKSASKSVKKLTVPRTKDELKTEKNKLDKLFIIGLLESTNGNVMEASRISGMDRSQIHHLMSRFEINSADYRKQE
jgi:DNA-binding NtrC family response regulator